MTVSNQEQVAYSYDNENRLTQITYPDQSTVSFVYDYRGRRTSMTDQNGKTTCASPKCCPRQNRCGSDSVGAGNRATRAYGFRSRYGGSLGTEKRGTLRAWTPAKQIKFCPS